MANLGLVDSSQMLCYWSKANDGIDQPLHSFVNHLLVV